MSNRMIRLFVPALLLLVAAGPAAADYALNMTRGVTEYSQEVYRLHMIILWVCVAIGAVVFGAMFYSMARFRKSKGAVADTKMIHSTRLEILWTVIPVAILVVMAVPATKALIKGEDTSNPDLTVKVTGYQWKWKYEYQGMDIQFISSLAAEHNYARQLKSGRDPNELENYLLDVDNPLVLPANKKVRFLIASDDVIHAWWVPELGWKQDAIPGFINEAWTLVQEPGVYRGQCAELCGKDHGFMPVVVNVLPEAEFDAWVAEQQQLAAAAAAKNDREWAVTELLDHGAEIYQQNCAACHQPNGEGLAPAFPALAGSEVALGPMDDHLKVVLDGRPGTGMQGWRDRLSDSDIAALMTYTRNAWGNDTGDVVQPREIGSAL